jgi:ferredoxin-NADP reductase
VVEGDEVEVRGPFAPYFVWRGESPRVLIGGGSGVVPLMCMLRHQRRVMPEADMRLIFSVRSGEDLIYADELGEDAIVTYTREVPDGWQGHTGRIDAAMIDSVAAPDATVFVCGSNGFVEAASSLALEAGVDASRIRTERFGPTGF